MTGMREQGVQPLWTKSQQSYFFLTLRITIIYSTTYWINLALLSRTLSSLSRRLRRQSLRFWQYSSLSQQNQLRMSSMAEQRFSLQSLLKSTQLVMGMLETSFKFLAVVPRSSHFYITPSANQTQKWTLFLVWYSLMSDTSGSSSSASLSRNILQSFVHLRIGSSRIYSTPSSLTLQTPLQTQPFQDSSIAPVKPLYQGRRGLAGGAPYNFPRIHLAIQRGLQQGMQVLQPEPMPYAPLIKERGRIGMYHMGSTSWPSSSRQVSVWSSGSGNRQRVVLLRLVKMYLAEACSLPPWLREPNWPRGWSRLTLLEPTKSWAMLTMVSEREASPWWQAECSATQPMSCATLISWRRLRLKQAQMILRWPGLSPSTREGIERMLSRIEKWMNSSLMKVLQRSFLTRQSTFLLRSQPSSHCLRWSAFFLLKTRSIDSSSSRSRYSNSSRCRSMSLKYSCASLSVDVPSPLQYLMCQRRRSTPSAQCLKSWTEKKDLTSGPLLALRMGVMNSLRKPLSLKREGQKEWTKLRMRPLMCEPSVSWSVIIITDPYRRLFVSSYCLPICSPRIRIRFWISWFSIICLFEASRTFSSLPRSGNTPKWSRPTISIPAIASPFALSPSVRISVHFSLFREPASLASSSLGMPEILAFLPPAVVLDILLSSLALASLMIDSTTPDLRMALMNFSESSGELPNWLALVTRVSLVWESKLGFSIRQFTNIHRCCFIWCGFTFRSFDFFAICSWIFDTTCSIMQLTWVPPRLVQIPFTNDTWLNSPSLKLAITCHRSLEQSFSTTRGSSPFMYSLTQSSKLLTAIWAPLQCTLTFPPKMPARSQARFFRSPSIWRRPSILNSLKSGQKRTQVKSEPECLLTLASECQLMFLVHSMKNLRPRFPSAASTENLFEKMLASLAPQPLRPPTTFFSQSLQLVPVSRCPKMSSGTQMLQTLWMTTGMPCPLLVTSMKPSFTSTTILIEFMDWSRWQLSAALTSTSSKILYRAGTYSISSFSNCYVSLTTQRLARVCSMLPTQVSGRSRMCSRGDFFWNSSSIVFRSMVQID